MSGARASPANVFWIRFGLGLMPGWYHATAAPLAHAPHHSSRHAATSPGRPNALGSSCQADHQQSAGPGLYVTILEVVSHPRFRSFLLFPAPNLCSPLFPIGPQTPSCRRSEVARLAYKNPPVFYVSPERVSQKQSFFISLAPSAPSPPLRALVALLDSSRFFPSLVLLSFYSFALCLPGYTTRRSHNFATPIP